MTKLKKILNEPRLALNILCRRYLNISFVRKVFTYKAEYRSDSENGKYAAAVVKALSSQKAFDEFKRNSDYREILEHVSFDQGRDYLDVVLSRGDSLFDHAINNIFQLDEVGNPIKYQYSILDKLFNLSPTTLRYLKVASDLKGLFGSNLNRIAEIGCGYGGQTLVNDQLLDFKHVTLFDLPLVNQLINRYLNANVLNGAYRVTTINETPPEKYDLAISNYAFSELPLALQKAYIKKVLINSTRGYLTMNTGLYGPGSAGKLSFNELRELLPPFEIYEEKPNTHEFNYIIVWGHNKDFATKHLTLKQA